MSDTFDVVVSRTFPVPPDQVWRAWGESDLVKQWWGPTGFSCPVADVDLRLGGRTLVAMRAPAEFGGARGGRPYPDGQRREPAEQQVGGQWVEHAAGGEPDLAPGPG